MHWPVRPSSCAPTASKSWLTRTCCQLGKLRRDTRSGSGVFFLPFFPLFLFFSLFLIKKGSVDLRPLDSETENTQNMLLDSDGKSGSTSTPERPKISQKEIRVKVRALDQIDLVKGSENCMRKLNPGGKGRRYGSRRGGTKTSRKTVTVTGSHFDIGPEGSGSGEQDRECPLP